MALSFYLSVWRVLLGLGGDVGRWKERLGCISGRCRRVYGGLGGDVGVGQRQVVGVGVRTGRVRGVSAGVSGFFLHGCCLQ